MTSALDRRVIQGSVGWELIPYVDAASLIDLVNQYEEDRGYAPAGGYAGLIPAHFNFGDLTRYYLGRGDRQWPEPGQAWLLACDCGEVGCWPLQARIHVDEPWSGVTSVSPTNRDGSTTALVHSGLTWTSMRLQSPTR